jgi:hypothetical protein
VSGAWTEIQVAVFWVMTPCIDVGYHRFGGPCCLHLPGEVSGAWIKIQVVIFWVMTPCSDVVGHHRSIQGGSMGFKCLYSTAYNRSINMAFNDAFN